MEKMLGIRNEIDVSVKRQIPRYGSAVRVEHYRYLKLANGQLRCISEWHGCEFLQIKQAQIQDTRARDQSTHFDPKIWHDSETLDF